MGRVGGAGLDFLWCLFQSCSAISNGIDLDRSLGAVLMFHLHVAACVGMYPFLVNDARGVGCNLICGFK